ncbi:ABC transporter permease [Maricaulis sp.]|uniref:ABC transporter permease n=1 Tax=Maricaulis sp. TaxID=1486257 RepID=UPI00261D139E|nr:ABC transporter permease [Maricaulis sp.]
MISIFAAEVLKLRRSLVLLVGATPPVMVFALAVMVRVTGNAPEEWSLQIAAGAAVWAYFLLPMTAIGVTALLAQLEHTPGTWSHTLALPVAKWKIFLAKAVTAQILMLIISVLVALASIGGGLAGGWISPDHAAQGDIDLLLSGRLYGLMFLASFLVTAIQWTLAMRFASFAVPVSLGIAGTFVAVAATSARSGLYFPWLMPVNVLASDAERAALAITLGTTGGLILYAAAIIWLSRRDWL